MEESKVRRQGVLGVFILPDGGRATNLVVVVQCQQCWCPSSKHTEAEVRCVVNFLQSVLKHDRGADIKFHPLLAILKDAAFNA